MNFLKSRLLILSFLLAPVAQAESADIRILISGIQSSAGSIVARAYNKGNWLSDTPLASTDITLPNNFSGEQLTLIMTLEPGEYAFSAYHDVDGNGIMNRNMIGLPAEPAGLSNNHRPRFGPPRYRKAKLIVTPGINTVAIQLN
ncbi:MAG: DUF2141 domain-containing protein [Spongiibacteraceae bacterium]